MALLQSLPGLAPEANAFIGLQLATLRKALLCRCSGVLPSKPRAILAPKALLQEQQAFVKLLVPMRLSPSALRAVHLGATRNFTAMAKRLLQTIA